VHLANDYIHPTPRGGRCRIRIYLPEDERDAPVVIRYHKLGVPPVWIEHYPKEVTDRHSETFELVMFSSYEVRERAPYLGETKRTIGEPTGRPSIARVLGL
jgi:hypothetical protein